MAFRDVMDSLFGGNEDLGYANERAIGTIWHNNETQRLSEGLCMPRVVTAEDIAAISHEAGALEAARGLLADYSRQQIRKANALEQMYRIRIQHQTQMGKVQERLAMTDSRFQQFMLSHSLKMTQTREELKGYASTYNNSLKLLEGL